MPFFEAPSLGLHYRVDGPEGGPGIVLINSLGTDLRIWDDVTVALQERFRVLRYDERGQGLSDGPPGPYSIRDHADDLMALLDHLGWRSAVLCGLSIGGMIAMQAWASAPDRVRGLVLSDTDARIGTRAFWEERIRVIRERGIAPFADSILERWFGASFRGAQPAAVRGWKNLLLGASIEGYLGSCAALRDADLSGVAGSIQAPALCICGSEDVATPAAAMRALAARIPEARFAELAGAGHLPPVERPCEFALLVADFLEVPLAT